MTFSPTPAAVGLLTKQNHIGNQEKKRLPRMDIAMYQNELCKRIDIFKNHCTAF